MEVTLIEPLTPQEVELWNRYLAEHRDGLRKRSLLTLDAFARSVARSPERRDRFARQLCMLVVDHGVAVPLGFAVKTHILFPTLTEAFEQGSADAARWMGGLYYHLSGLPIWQAWFIDERRLYSDVTVLQEAYRRDPVHPKVQSMLVQAWERWIAHTVHEVPSGVLVGMNGASIEDCVVLRERLAAFRALTETAGVYDEYREWIDECDRWYRWYIDYLTHRHAYKSFMQYAEIMEQRERA